MGSEDRLGLRKLLTSKRVKISNQSSRGLVFSGVSVRADRRSRGPEALLSSPTESLEDPVPEWSLDVTAWVARPFPPRDGTFLPEDTPGDRAPPLPCLELRLAAT